ncbi:cell division protein DivIVA [Ammoniphilus oxalaticus]|uniref:Cell division protein DivIVA n=1 Tax=Ammoniphilus oxalaticus TaxID=66863 RepID=A0A419SJG4_9BACL|nr:DivIVA domain-containing protein [Ammoniphilus oxalaticus]RKD24117.1 cell division protein DivIVA [Ammoniphilus oxalaticus]
MALTPLDIHNKEFSKAFRGYDEDEVNEFLDQIIKDMELLLKDKREMEEKVAVLSERLTHFTNIEETLSKSILVAQETGEEVKANARKEAQLIIKEAEKNADRIINESLIKSKNIAMEIEELKKTAAVYRIRFRSLLEAQMEMLDSGNWDQFEKLEEDLKNEKEQIETR